MGIIFRGYFGLVNMKCISIIFLLITLMGRTQQHPVGDISDAILENDVDYRTDCAPHCVEAYYDSSSEYAEQCADWCYEMYFYESNYFSDEDSMRSEERKMKLRQFFM